MAAPNDDASGAPGGLPPLRSTPARRSSVGGLLVDLVTGLSAPSGYGHSCDTDSGRSQEVIETIPEN
jgi:hypothetical protein